MSSAAPPPSVVVFDFDLTLVDVNSDTYVPGRLEPALLAHIRAESRRGAAWTPLMDDVLGRLHAAGHGEAALAGALRAMPVQPALPAAVRAAAAAGAQVHVVSDANTFYIETALAHLALRPLVASVVTNPAAFDAAGRLRVAPYARAPHGCARCPPNLCKGAVLDGLLPRGARVFYAGDGGGDVCPALRLRAGSVACARAGCDMAKTLRKLHAAAPLAVTVVEWRDGQDLLDALQAWLAEGESVRGAAPART